MVSQKKIRTVKEVGELIRDYRVIGILDMHKLPARQLHQIRGKLKGKATIRMVKKRLINLILQNSKLKNLEDLAKSIQGEPALLLSNENPFKLARIISESKSKAVAKPGDVAPEEIMIKAGPTPLPPGPVIGELQKVKIPAMVQGDKIAVRQDTVVAKKGDVIEKSLAGILAKLGIEPMEIGLNLIAVWESEIIYGSDILFIPAQKYVEDIRAAHSRAYALTLGIEYYTKDNVSYFLSKAHRQATALATKANFLTKETMKPLLAKADAHAKEIRKHVKEPEAKAEAEPKEAPAEKAKEKAKEVEKKPEPEEKPEKGKGKE
jgi:large subunit ribosomal protein L10